MNDYGGAMEWTCLLASTLLALIGAVWGALSLYRGARTWGTMICLIAAFVLQLVFLKLRGDVRGACPLRDSGEILVFLAWALTAFYLLVGRSYRLSLIGLFTAPVVVIFQGVALFVPGSLDVHPVRCTGVDAWRETHSAVSVVAYGAFALAAVSGVMFLVLDKQLKAHHLQSGLFKKLPPARELLHVVQRLLWIGFALLTFGIFAGWLMPHKGAWPHFIAAIAVWLAYAVLLAVLQFRGITGRKLSLFAVALFFISLGVFAKL